MGVYFTILSGLHYKMSRNLCWVLVKGDTVMSKSLSDFWNDESGISSVEYALLLAFVAAGIIVAADSLSNAVSNQMEGAANCIEGTSGSANC